VSTTTSPVTQEAEADVKKASINDVESPSRHEKGSIRRAVPNAISIKKPRATILG
jgi:hypothetical protein